MRRRGIVAANLTINTVDAGNWEGEAMGESTTTTTRKWMWRRRSSSTTMMDKEEGSWA